MRKVSKQEREVFTGRLHALAHAHEALTGDVWDRAPVRELVARTLEPFAADRFSINGPDVCLTVAMPST